MGVGVLVKEEVEVVAVAGKLVGEVEAEGGRLR